MEHRSKWGSLVSDPLAPTTIAARPLLAIDRDKFRQNFNKRHFLLEHRLSGNALFALPRLIDLARDTARTRPDDLYYDAGVTDVNEKWGQSPAAFPVDETIKRIETAGAWIALKARKRTPPTRSCSMSACRDILEVSGRDLERNMRRKEVIVFITSPNRLTTYHIDSECNFLLPSRGDEADQHLSPGRSRSAPGKRARSILDAQPKRAAIQAAFAASRRRNRIRAGNGRAYPINAPHWVQNGNNISVAVSINYHSWANERANIYR